MARFRKLTGVHCRVEDGKKVAYKPGDVIEATEAELRNVDENLVTWEKVDDDTPISGSQGRTMSKNNFIQLFRQNSKILNLDKLLPGEYVDLEGELFLRTTADRTDDNLPVNLIEKEEINLQRAIDEARYQNDIQPVNSRSNGEPTSESIERCRAYIQVLQEEAEVLAQRCKKAVKRRDDRAEKTEARKRKQARALAYHPAYKHDPAAMEARKEREKPMKRTKIEPPVKVANRLKGATA
jgi:hypothetical protein